MSALVESQTTLNSTLTSANLALSTVYCKEAKLSDFQNEEIV